MDASDTSAFLPHETVPVEEEMLIKNLLISNDPAGLDIDSEILLRAVKSTFHLATSSETKFDTAEITEDSQVEAVGLQAFTGNVIHKISHEMFYKHHQMGNLQTRTMNLLDLLGNFRWNEKMVLILAGLVSTYSEFWLVIRLSHHNPLAESISVLKQLPTDLELLKPRLKALNLLIGKMVELTECVVKFDNLAISEVEIDSGLIEITKHHMYMVAYWVARSAIIGSSHISDLRAAKPKRVCRHSTAAAAWELLSLVLRLSNLLVRLQRLVEVCHRQTEAKIYEKLSSLLKEDHTDNQEVLRVLFSLKDDLPFKKSVTQEKVGLSEFKDKVLVLFISKPDLPAPEELLLLYHQMYNHPGKCSLEGSYEMIYVPIQSSSSWVDSEGRNYEFTSDLLPWYSIRKPHFIGSAVANFIRQEWDCRDGPIGVVINTEGSVTNLNAIDTMKIWGPEGYPFSASREEELWKAEKSTLGLMLNRIDPLSADRIREGRNICVYGGDDVRWIREFHAKIEETIRHAGLQLDLVYVGKRTLTSPVRNILLAETRVQERMSDIPLSTTSIRFFWMRLDSIRRSILRHGDRANADHILRDVSGLLELDESKTSWAMFGDGLSRYTLTLRGKELMECLDMFPGWRGNVPKWGLVQAMRMALEPPKTSGPCSHSEMIPFEEPLVGKTLFCNRCRRPMKNFVVYG